MSTKPDGSRELILGKIHLAVRTEFFKLNEKNMNFLADDIIAHIDKKVNEALDRVEEEVIGEDEIWNIKENYGYRQQYQNQLKKEQHQAIKKLRSEL